MRKGYYSVKVVIVKDELNTTREPKAAPAAAASPSLPKSVRERIPFL